MVMEKMAIQALLHTVIETTDDIIFVKDLSGRYLLVNAAAARVLGCSPEEAAGKAVADLFPPEVAARLEEDDRRVLEGGHPLTAEESLPLAGSPRIYLTRTAPYRDAEGQIAGLIARTAQGADLPLRHLGPGGKARCNSS
jgi:PAS domain S-box-containing protein